MKMCPDRPSLISGSYQWLIACAGWLHQESVDFFLSADIYKIAFIFFFPVIITMCSSIYAAYQQNHSISQDISLPYKVDDRNNTARDCRFE